MFVNRLRKATLALSVGTLLASSVVFTTAAAPAPHLESVSAKPKIDLARADFSVARQFKQGDPPYNVMYVFLVRNNGPERAAVKIIKKVKYLDQSNTVSETTIQEYVESFDSGTQRSVPITCDPPAGLYCADGGIELVTLGLDPDTSNNTRYWSHVAD